MYGSVELLVAASAEIETNYGDESKVQIKAAVQSQLTVQLTQAQDENGDYDPESMVEVSSTLSATASLSFSGDFDLASTVAGAAGELGASAANSMNELGSDITEFIMNLWEAISALLNWVDYMP